MNKNIKITVFPVKANPYKGTSFKEVWKQAQQDYKQTKQQTKRRPYIRSKYFNKKKIFFDMFWIHLSQKGYKQRTKRLKYFRCAIELIEKSIFKPTSKNQSSNIVLHRFTGITRNNNKFYVQIKEEKKSNKLYLMSVFTK